MKKSIEYKKLLIELILILVGCTTAICQYVDTSRRPVEELTNQEYMYAFTEATRYYIFGNFVQAVGLYKECLKIRPESGAVHFQLAKIYLNSGNSPLAREHAKKACFLDPENKWYLQELGDIYQVEQKFDSAAVIYKRLMVADKGNVSVIYGIASLLEKDGQYNEALQYLDMVDQRIGISKEVSMNRYRIYEALVKPDLALVNLQVAERLSDEDYTLTGLIAEHFRQQNMPDSAYAYYNRIFPRYSNDPLVTMSYAEFLLEEDKKDSAEFLLLAIMKDASIDNMVKTGYFYKLLQSENDFMRALPVMDTLSEVYLASNLEDIRAISIYADLQLRLRHFAKAAEALKIIVDRDQGNYLATEQFIYTLNLLGKADSVILLSDKAIASFGDRDLLYLLNGSANYQKKNFTRAIESLEKGLVKSKTDELMLEFYSLLAECYQSINAFDKAEAAFKEALLIDGNNFIIMNNYAYYLSLQEKNLKMAKKMSEATVKANPDSDTFLDTYAWVLFKMGKVNQAKHFILLAIAKGGDKNIEILSHAADIYTEVGEYSEAMKYLNSVLELSLSEDRDKVLMRMKYLREKMK